MTYAELLYYYPEQFFSYQSWYFGYVLAIFFVITAFWICKMSGKTSFVLWMPIICMIIINICLEIIYEECLVYIEKNSYMDIYGASNNESSSAMKYYDIKCLTFAGLRRWIEAEWRYAIFTALCSCVGYLVVDRIKRHSIGGVCAVVILVVLSICIIDRSVAFSARLIFELGVRETPEKQWFEFVSVEKDGEEFWGAKIMTLGANIQNGGAYVIDEPVAVYESDSISAPLCYLACGTVFPKTSFRGLGLIKKANWMYISQGEQLKSDEPWYDENGNERRICVGYIRIEDFIGAVSWKERGGVRGHSARLTLMSDQIFGFSSGIYLSPNIMHAFMPLEMYILCPLFVLLFSSWLWMTVTKKRSEVKA